MATLKEMREKAARTLTEARSMLDGIADDATAEVRAEAEQSVDRALDDVSRIESDIDRREKMERAEQRMTERLEQVDESKRPSMGGEARGVDEGETIEYRDAFHSYLRSKAEGAEPLSAEARAVLTAGYAKVEHRAQTTTNAAGGYMIPVELQNVLIKSMAMWGPMYDEAVATTLTTTGGGRLTMPTVDDTANESMVVNHTEAATLTDDGGADVTFGEKQLDAFAFNTEWLRLSKELLDDSIFAVEQIIGDLLGERLGRKANTQLTVGTGSSSPNGIVTASSLGITAAGAAAITSDEIIDLVHSVDPAYRQGPRVRFMFNDQTLATIRKLKDGDGNYLWQMGNVQQGEPGSLLGYRYSVNQAMANIATGNRSMVFGDFGKYYVRKVGAPLIGAISDKDFWPGVGIAGYIRFDGELADTAAVKHLIQA